MYSYNEVVVKLICKGIGSPLHFQKNPKTKGGDTYAKLFIYWC